MSDKALPNQTIPFPIQGVINYTELHLYPTTSCHCHL